MLIYNLIEYSDNYSKTFGILWQYCRDEPSNPIKNSKSLTFKSRLLNNTSNAGATSVETGVSFIKLLN